MNDSIVKVVGLSHRYSSQWAIKNIDFEITGHGILGLLGSNGAGKSTTMNIICGVLNQTEGRVFINGINLREHPEEAKKYLGFLPQKPPLHPDLTVDEYLIHCANLRSINRMDIKPAINAAKDKCGISHFSKRLVRNLSGGYQQRLGIAQAIVHNPLFVVLDEPTNGLDPNQIVEVRKLIKEIAAERCVLLSTHILSEVQATCDYIRMIEGGQMVFSGTIQDFDNYIEPDSVLLKLQSPPAVEKLLSIPNVTGVKELAPHIFRLSFTGSPEIVQELVKLSVSENWNLSEIRLEKHSMDEVFATLSNKAFKNSSDLV